MPTLVTRDGATLHYAVHDFTDRWRKPDTIILVHGFSRSGDFWFGMIPYLARFYRVICPDLRGLGKSRPLADPHRAISLEAYLADIAAVADHAGAETFHLAGEALGGAISLMFAAEHQRRVRTLSVIAPAVWINDWLRSSYAIGLTLEHTNRAFAERYGLPDADYAAHGGCFPIHVAGTGIIGAVTVSGLTQREDHNLVVEALCLALKKDHDSLRLPDPQ